MTNVVSPDAKATYYEYDASGLVRKKLLGNLSATYFRYDFAGRLESLRNVKSDGTPLSYFEYTRLAGGNISKVVREDGGAVYYSYDDADRLTKEVWADSGGSQVYAYKYDYDAAGNRTKEEKNGTGIYYYYDAANELTNRVEAGGEQTYYAYDENGSMVTEHRQVAAETTYFEYADNGLVSKIIPATGSPTQMYYDARLQRYSIDFSGTLRYFQWDALNQLVEKDANLSTVAQHTHGYSPIEGIGTVIISKRSSDYQYPHYDHRGSLFDLEDTGAEDLVAEYNAWGEELARTGAAVTRFGYQGTAWMRLPIGSGMYLLSPTRVPRPDIGRFLQRDPLPLLVSVRDFSEGNSLGRWAPVPYLRDLSNEESYLLAVAVRAAGNPARVFDAFFRLPTVSTEKIVERAESAELMSPSSISIYDRVIAQGLLLPRLGIQQYGYSPKLTDPTGLFPEFHWWQPRVPLSGWDCQRCDGKKEGDFVRCHRDYRRISGVYTLSCLCICKCVGKEGGKKLEAKCMSRGSQRKDCHWLISGPTSPEQELRGGIVGALKAARQVARALGY